MANRLGPDGKRLYGARWRAARAAQLQREPLCRMCADMGRTKAADTVDHIRPHKGDTVLFWDSTNWQSLCRNCHDSTKAQLERGTLRGCDANGVPLDPGHHWRKVAG